MLTIEDLHSYQKSFANAIVNKDGVFGVLDMGLGKTISTLTAVEWLQRVRGLGPAMVIAPLRVCYNVWPQETQKWAHTAHMRSVIIHGNKKAQKINEPADLYITNFETIPFISKTDLFQKCDILIIDESSFVKSHKTKTRFKPLKKHAVGQFKKVVLLTGTPSGSGQLWELWSQIFMIDGGQRLGSTYYWFQQRYYSKKDHYGYKWELKQGAREQIIKKINDVSVVFRAKDHLDMPERIDNGLIVNLPDNVMADYKALEKDFLLELKQDTTITVANAAVMSGKLRQVCAGGLYYDDRAEWMPLHQEKIKALEEVTESAEGGVLCFYWFNFEAEMIRKKFKDAAFLRGNAKQTQVTIRKWNNGEIKLLCLHPASAGHGLNLQGGGHIGVWLTMTWSLDQMQQAEARIYRQGQGSQCVFHKIICKDTIDEVVCKSLGAKDAGQEGMIQRLMQYGESKFN